MRRSSALTVSAVMIASGVQLALPSQAQAATDCVLRPVLPARVVVNQSVVGLRVPIAIKGPSDCRVNVSARTYLVHRTDSMFMYWHDTAPYSESVYASLVSPGTYRTTAGDCSSYDANYNDLSCSLLPASTVIKFAGRAKLSAKRVGRKVTLTAKTGRFEAYEGSAPTTTRIAIQRLSGHKWKTVKRATAKGKKGYAWTFTKKAKARYRVVALENGAAFAATSRSIKK